MSRPCILVVEDNPDAAAEIARQLRSLDYGLAGTAASPPEAEAVLATGGVDLVLMDIVLQDGADGIRAAEWIRRRFETPVIFLTGYDDESLVERARLTEPHGYLIKPVSKQDLGAAITVALQRVAAERERLLRELRAANNELENFVYTISHDLKTPLVTIGGFAGLLERDLARGDRAAVADDLREIRAAAEHMRRLIDGLLSLSRNGHIVGVRRPVPLNGLVDRALKFLENDLRHQRAEVRVAPGLPVIEVDPQRCTQVLEAMVDNALKYRRDGVDPAIEIGAETGRNRLRIYVRDNGRGIPPEDQGRVFELFERAGPKGTGTGIGLALARRIVEAHGGELTLESRPGSGSTFWIALPLSVIVDQTNNQE